MTEAVAESAPEGAATLGLLFDARRCTGCGACALACRERNHLPKEEALDRIGERSFLGIAPVRTSAGVRFARRSCMHCAEPACVSACPVTALRRQPDGSVIYVAELCIGCRYCVFACPFDVPRYEWSAVSPSVRKCHLCWQHRTEHAGSATACAEVCPAGALAFGPRGRLLDEARARIAGGGYQPEIYGEREVGGAGVLVLSDVPFSELGLPLLPRVNPLPGLTWNYLSRVPNVASGVAVGLAGIWWIIRRRQELSGGSEHA